MNEVIRAIKERRSVRRYKPEAPPKELIDAVIEAGLWAPSGHNRQDVLIVAVTDPAVRAKLSAVNAEIWGSRTDPFYGAPVILIVLAERGWYNADYDGSLALGSMMLAAHSLGLGSCWINRAKEEFDLPEWQEFLRSIGVAGEWKGVGHLALGFPDGETPKTPRRKPNRVFYVE